jgi:hypothetical protein
MMTTKRILAAASILGLVSACVVHDSNSSTETGVGNAADVVGTYVAADSGHTLGKNWCYSGALVLDSTNHFGSVLTMCSDEGSPVTEHIKGTYQVRTVRVRVKGQPTIRRLAVVLDQEGRGKTHTMRYDAGTLRFEEPWWLGAGLRALDVADPVMKKVPESALPDATVAAASSTPSGITKGTVLRVSSKPSKLPPK